MKTYKLSDLILDYNLYPRNAIDNINISQLTEALRAGIKLPPIIIDEKTKRIVDGFHRHHAYRIIYDENYETEIIEKTYKNEGEIFLDAVKYNSGHGKSLDTYDKKKCIIKAEELSINEKLITEALSLTIDKYGKLKGQLGFNEQGKSIPLKGANKHLAQQTLSEKQIEGNKQSLGVAHYFIFDQLINLFKNDLIDLDNPIIQKRCQSLYNLLKMNKIKFWKRAKEINH